MNKLFLLMSLAFFFGCSGGDEEPLPLSPNIPTGERTIKNQVEEYGIKPSNLVDIEYVTFIADSIEHKYLGGTTKDGTPFFSKFNPRGDELFLYTLKAENLPGLPVLAPVRPIVLVDNNVIFLRFWFLETINVIRENMATMLVSLNYSTGEEMGRTSPVFKCDTYDISIEKDFYFLEVMIGNWYSAGFHYDFGAESYYSFDKMGKILWRRTTTEEESKSTMKGYYGNRAMFLDNENIIIDKGSSYGFELFRVINLRNRSVTCDIRLDLEKLPNYEMENNTYKRGEVYMNGEKICIPYNKYNYRVVVDDPILGTTRDVYDLVATYYYEVSMSGVAVYKGVLQ